MFRKKLQSTLVGTSVGEAAIFAGAVPLAIVYTPAELGVFGAIAALSGLLAFGSTLSLDLAIPTSDSEEDAKGLAHVAMVSCASTTAAGVGLTIAFSAVFMDGNVVWFWATSVGAAVCSLGLFEIATAVLIRLDRYRALAQAKAARGIFQTTIQIALGIATDLGATGLIVGLVIGRLIPTVPILYSHCRSGWLSVRARSLLRKYRDFPRYSMPAQLAMLAGVQAPMLLTPILYGTDLAGHLFLTRRILAGPTSIMARSVGYVYFGEAAQLERNGERGERLFRRILLGCLLVGIGIAVVVGIGGRWIIPRVAGPEWSIAGNLLAIFAPAYALQIASAPLSRAFQVYGEQSRLLVWAILRLGLVLLTFAVISAYGVSFMLGMTLLASALIIGHITQLRQAWLVASRSTSETVLR